MNENVEMERLWESLPTIVASSILGYDKPTVTVGEEYLQDYLRKLALHFYRGGVATVPHFRNPTIVARKG